MNFAAGMEAAAGIFPGFFSVLAVLIEIWPYIVGIFLVVMALTASVHAILRWDDPRSTFAWMGVIWLSPFFGPLLYWMFGVNRVRRRVRSLRGSRRHAKRNLYVGPADAPEVVVEAVGEANAHLRPLSTLLDAYCDYPITRGNRVSPLFDGDEAYPEMIRAIESARRSVGLETYIFDNDEVGREFVAVLARAVARGVDVRVLVDGVGARYTFPSIVWRLRRAGVRTAVFHPTVFPWNWAYANLRDHRKILVVDGKTGFTGGMNIRRGHVLKFFGQAAASSRQAVRDVQFKIEGPLVGELQHAFAGSWKFATGRELDDVVWRTKPAERGRAVARGIPDAPDDRIQSIRWAMLGAISTARSSIRIATPYFLPDTALSTALNVAAVSGVKVQIIVPEKSNLTFVQWAMNTYLPQLALHGCEVRVAEAPFDHSKVMMIDDVWVLFGSSNWDSRSLRLSFEFNVECYDRELAGRMKEWFDLKTRRSRAVSFGEFESRSALLRLRDGFARMFSPYL